MTPRDHTDLALCIAAAVTLLMLDMLGILPG